MAAAASEGEPIEPRRVEIVDPEIVLAPRRAHYISFFVAIVMMYDPLKKLGRVSDFLATGAAAAE